MKKFILLGFVALLAFALALPAFAGNDVDPKVKTWFDQKFAVKQQYIDQAVKDGRLSAEQGETATKQIQERYQTLEQNDFKCPNGNTPGERARDGKRGGKGCPGPRG